MIKSITIQNFQSHEKAKLEFHPGVNVIIGSSDSGKTAIIRALRWVIWNRPSGNTIQSHWGGDTVVAIETEDAVKVIRSKGKIDKYISHVTGEEDMEFKAFGTSVPEEIVQFFNINEINLQRQFDSSFLLSETPGAVASHFNKIAHLDKIDSGLQKINSWIRELTSNIKYKEEQEKKSQEELTRYEHLDKFESEVEVLEEMSSQLTQYRSKYQKLLSLIESITDIKVDIQVEEYDLRCEKSLNAILTDIDKKYKLQLQQEAIDNLLDVITNIQYEIKEEEKLTDVGEPISIILGLYTEKKTAVDLNTSLVKLLSSINNIILRLNNAKGIQAKLQAEWDKIEICPFCGSKLK